jgi:Ca-activated chloride channel family protein
MGSTLMTIARDVKVQSRVQPGAGRGIPADRLRKPRAAARGFRQRPVDAGDIGAGHEVTALYEITPAGSAAVRVPALRYGAATERPSACEGKACEVATCACATSCRHSRAAG